MLTTTELKRRCRYLAESLWDNDVKYCMKKVVYFFLNIDYGLLTLPEVVKFFEKSELGPYFGRKDINWRDYPIENIIYQCTFIRAFNSSISVILFILLIEESAKKIYLIFHISHLNALKAHFSFATSIILSKSP